MAEQRCLSRSPRPLCRSRRRAFRLSLCVSAVGNGAALKAQGSLFVALCSRLPLRSDRVSELFPCALVRCLAPFLAAQPAPHAESTFYRRRPSLLPELRVCESTCLRVLRVLSCLLFAGPESGGSRGVRADLSRRAPARCPGQTQPLCRGGSGVPSAFRWSQHRVTGRACGRAGWGSLCARAACLGGAAPRWVPRLPDEALGRATLSGT